jgi:nucleotide-binding universal stress UspA family protein
MICVKADIGGGALIRCQLRHMDDGSRAMTFKTLLVHAQAGAEPRLQTAVGLARAHGARVIGLGAEMFEPLTMADPYGFAQGEWLALMRDQIEKDLDLAQQAFERCAADVEHEWRRVVDLPTPSLARTARAADLIVTGGAPHRDRSGYRSADIGELIVTAGRPVLVAPPSGGELSGRRVLVAWKDTREARRATLDALPLLTRAEQVTVVAVVPEDQVEAAEFQTDEVAAWLQRHGAPAQGQVIAGFDDEAGAQIQLLAAGVDADLIVAGGYGHNRFTEWLLGGVTRALLTDAAQFVLFSH